MLLVGDIGGSKTQLALLELAGDSWEFEHTGRYSSPKYDSLTQIVQHFLGQHQAQVSHACFGVAGPVRAQRVEVTNLPWTLEAARLRAELALDEIWLLNDLQAIAEALPLLTAVDLLTLNPGTPEPRGGMAVLAPGTGLGEAFCTWDEERADYRAHPSEGGHCDFAPRDELQLELLRFMLERYEHVSYERLASGIGLPNIYKFLSSQGNFREPDWLHEELHAAQDPTPVIIAAALDEERDCKLCIRCLELFCDIIAAEAANLALKTWATGGVFIGGGIPPRIQSFFTDKRLLAAYLHKGRFKEQLGRIPLHLILNPHVALLGAAHHGRRQAAQLPAANGHRE